MAEKCPEHNAECKSESHNRHLCYFVAQGFHLSDQQQYRQLVENPQFKCQYCGRVANSEENLCKPVNL